MPNRSWEQLQSIDCQKCITDADSQSDTDVKGHDNNFTKSMIGVQWANEKIADVNNPRKYQQSFNHEHSGQVETGQD